MASSPIGRATMSPAFSHVAIDFTGHLNSMLCGENKSGKSHPMLASFHVQLQEWYTLSWQMTGLLIECIILYIMANKDITMLSLTYIWTTIDFTRLQREIAPQGWICRFLWLVSNTMQAPLLPYHLWLGTILLITEKCLNILNTPGFPSIWAWNYVIKCISLYIYHMGYHIFIKGIRG